MTASPLHRLAAEDEETRKRKGTLHTPGEILQQPWLWRETAGRLGAVADRAAALLRDARFAWITGAGSSLHAGLLVEDAARARFDQAHAAVSCTDLMLFPGRFVGTKGVLLSLSRSGESPEIVEAVRAVAEGHPDVAHLAVTCNASGRLARQVEGLPNGLSLALHEKAYDRGLGTTSSVTATVVAGRFLLHPLAPEEYAERVGRLAGLCEIVLGTSSNAAHAIAERVPARIVVLGTGSLEAAAKEVAHKALELTDGRIAGMARSCLEFRHGPIAFVDAQTLVVCLLSPHPDVAPYEADFIRQLHGSRAAGRVVAFGPREVAEALRAHADEIVGYAEGTWLDEAEAGLLAVVFGQMLALFLSLNAGLTPDRPGNRGLVNPVVQGVTIHPRGGKP